MGKRRVHFLVCLLVLGVVGSAMGELVGHWMLNENGGTVAVDSSGKGNDGTIVNNPTWITGVEGTALEFHGLGAPGGGGDYIDCGSDASLDVRGPISIAIWLRPGADEPEANGTETAPLAKADSAAGWSWQLRYGWGSSQPFMGFQFNATPSRVWVYVGENLERDEWCHVAASHDGSTVTCYYNGLPTESAAMSTFAGQASSLLIGSDGWGCDWIGGIDDVRIYNHALTGAEIAEICPPSRIAKDPDPADGATSIVTPLLRWEAGYAALMHEVYLGTTPDLGPDDLVQPRQPMTMYWHAPGVEPGVTYYWRVDEIEADMTTVNTGDVWSFTTQALTAYMPTPADGAVDASTSPTLSWLAGQAAMKHHIYFGDSADAVAEGAAGTDKGEIEETTFAPGDLDPVASYFWRVDEVLADGDVKTGPVWSFTTCLPVDDFESYTDEEGSRIYETWIDGWTNDTGSTVGYVQAPFAEQAIIHGGAQSMPLDYNNVNAPFLSEAELTFAPVADWTAGGVDTLVLHIRGRVNNSPTLVYVGVQDASNNTGVILSPDAAISTATKWAEWKIPLSKFSPAGVNMARVKKLIIGVGDRPNPATDGAGLMFVDDIYLTKPAQSQ